MFGFALSLISGLSWGISDFIGGLVSRRLHVITVLAVSQGTGLIVALLILVALGEGQLEAADFALAAVAGAAAVAALAAFYHALAIGTMSVVAPIAATGVAVPVAVGLLRGEAPTAIQLGGIALAITGVVVLSRYQGEGGSGTAGRLPILLALASAVGFGAFFVIVDSVAEASPLGAVVAARIGAVIPIAVAVAAIRPPRPSRGDLPTLAAIGLLDLAAVTLFAYASTEGLLPLVAVGGSMYPAFTIILAQVVLGERLARPQRWGVVAALAGVLAIAAGS